MQYDDNAGQVIRPADNFTGRSSAHQNAEDHGLSNSPEVKASESAAISPEEKLRAAAWAHVHDVHWTPDAKAAFEAASALIERTWKQDRAMTRDEKRLLKRYSAITDRDEAETVAAYREAMAAATQQ